MGANTICLEATTVYGHFQSICQLLGDEVQDIIAKPLFWVMLFLLLCCMVFTYSNASQNRLTTSIINTLRQFGTFFIDVFNSIIQAFKSLFGFLDVLRLLFFGRLGNATLYVLTNYAIIFLSIASFTTTMQGMRSLIGLTGLFVSFGVQVLELVSIMGLIICRVPPKSKLRETVHYQYALPGMDNPCENHRSRQGTTPASAQDTAPQENVQDPSEQFKAPAKEERSFWWGQTRRRMLPLILSLAYIVSVLFSYFYIFDAVVMPEIAYDDYMESISLVMTTTEEFEQDMSSYRTELVQGLNRLNNSISQQLIRQDPELSTLEARLQKVQAQVDDARTAVENALASMQGIDTNDPRYEALNSMYLDARTNYNNLSQTLESLRQKAEGSSSTLFQEIQLLTRYYADPLYLARGDAGIDDVIDDVTGAFTAVMTDGLPLVQTDLAVNADSLRTAFNNYTLISRYYAEHNGSGLDLVSGPDSVSELLARRADVMAEYDRLKNAQGDASAEAAKNYLNGETGKLLIAMMQSLENVPQLQTVGELWPGSSDTRIRPQEPGTAEYLNELNQRYRASNGQLSLQERALSKLISPNCKTSWFSMVIALTLDIMIIALCCLRARVYYSNNARTLRQMVAMLFIIPTTKAEEETAARGRRVILTGTVLGCFVYVLYFKLFSSSASNAIMAFILIICGIMLFALLDSVRSIFQKKQPVPGSADHGDDQQSEDSRGNPAKERLTTNAYRLFTQALTSGHFWKRCVVRRPKSAPEWAGADYYKKERELWRKKEDHKIRNHILSVSDYDIVVTYCGSDMEYYVLMEDVNACGLMLQFAILLSHDLVYCTEVPDNPVDSGNPDISMKPAYILTREFLRLLYECVLLRTAIGQNFSMEDDLLDYEREEDDDEE